MEISKHTFSLLALSIGVIFFAACDNLSSTSNSDYNSSYEEAPKTLAGEWQITEVSRNGNLITEQMDFSQFRISFHEDGSYQIENRLPFIVNGLEGTWSFDDPQYPFKLSLNSNISDTSVTTDLTYPIVEGKRNLKLNFTAGCSTVNYQYVLERTAQE